jgi:hypothetical protein
MSQLKTIRKGLSYAYELTGKKTKKMSNWPCISGQFESSIRPGLLKESTVSSVPTKIPTPKQLKKAILKGWHKGCGMSLLKWSVFYACFWDTQVCGARPKVDLNKIKKSTVHAVDYKAGWQCTQFLGGRSKLSGSKKGNRPWWMWRICVCKGKQHVRPCEDAWSYIDDDGNPTRKINWDPSCIMASIEFVQQLQHDEDMPPRCYPNVVERTARRAQRLGDRNVAFPCNAALDWMECQGLPRFDPHSGRKGLGRWCKKLEVIYKISNVIHLHGDLFEVWNEHYEEDLSGKVSIRKQSRDPEVATAGLRVFAGYLKRGFNPYSKPMTLLERQQHELLKLLAKPGVADRIRMGLPAEDSDSEAEEVTPKPKSRKRKRKKQTADGAAPARKKRKKRGKG